MYLSSSHSSAPRYLVPAALAVAAFALSSCQQEIDYLHQESRWQNPVKRPLGSTQHGYSPYTPYKPAVKISNRKRSVFPPKSDLQRERIELQRHTPMVVQPQNQESTEQQYHELEEQFLKVHPDICPMHKCREKMPHAH